jgi:glucose/arabinose dehydrogenase
MFVGIGDGGNGIAHQNDAIFGMPQDPSVVLGKILRINPAYTSNGARYGTPSSNPFYNRAGANKAVWALGLRHHQVMSFDTGGTRQLYIGAIGQNLIESIYQGKSGANYGWPNREGRFVTDRSNTNRLYNLPSPSIDATRGYTYPVAQYDHSNGIALAGGYVYRGQDIPELYGHYICGDISGGRVFHFSVDALVPGQPAVMKELTLLRSGQPVGFRDFVGGRPDLRFGQTKTGDVLLTTKRLGRLWRLAKA